MAVLFFLHRQNLQMEQEGLSGEKQLCDNPKRVDACPWDCRRRTAAGRYQWGTHTYFGEQKSPIQRQVVKETVPRDLHSSDSVIWGLTLSPRREPPSQSAPALHHSSPRPRQGPQLLRQSSGARLFPAKSLPGRAGCRAGVGAGSLGGAEPPAPAPGWTRGGGGGGRDAGAGPRCQGERGRLAPSAAAGGPEHAFLRYAVASFPLSFAPGRARGRGRRRPPVGLGRGRCGGGRDARARARGGRRSERRRAPGGRRESSAGPGGAPGRGVGRGRRSAHLPAGGGGRRHFRVPFLGGRGEGARAAGGGQAGGEGAAPRG